MEALDVAEAEAVSLRDSDGDELAKALKDGDGETELLVDTDIIADILIVVVVLAIMDRLGLPETLAEQDGCPSVRPTPHAQHSAFAWKSVVSYAPHSALAAGPKDKKMEV